MKIMVNECMIVKDGTIHKPYKTLFNFRQRVKSFHDVSGKTYKVQGILTRRD